MTQPISHPLDALRSPRAAGAYRRRNVRTGAGAGTGTEKGAVARGEEIHHDGHPRRAAARAHALPPCQNLAFR
jgi:hypothetical protein